jgi:hypothetical protein
MPYEPKKEFEFEEKNVEKIREWWSKATQIQRAEVAAAIGIPITALTTILFPPAGSIIIAGELLGLIGVAIEKSKKKLKEVL